MMAILRPMGNAARVTCATSGFPSPPPNRPTRADPEAAGPVLSRICASGTRVFWMCLKVFRGMNLFVAVFVTDHGPINGQAGLCPRLAFRCCR